jgi:hypothetical protein
MITDYKELHWWWIIGQRRSCTYKNHCDKCRCALEVMNKCTDAKFNQMNMGHITWLQNLGTLSYLLPIAGVRFLERTRLATSRMLRRRRSEELVVTGTVAATHTDVPNKIPVLNWTYRRSSSITRNFLSHFPDSWSYISIRNITVLLVVFVNILLLQHISPCVKFVGYKLEVSHDGLP